jgi:haloacid dehalogenase superfamily, subfamily IA, variant 3 with third motif having DD or ED
MIKNIIFDFGAVLLDWNPRRLFVPYFGGDEAKCDYFLGNICTFEWNVQMDRGKPIAQGTAELCAIHPEWEREIKDYFGRWIEMIGDQIPGMYDYMVELKEAGYKLYGLSNWSAETFCQVRHKFPIFDLLEGYVISGDVCCLKPEPFIYETLLGRYCLDPAECVFIDDNAANVAGGERHGIKGILFTDASALRRQLPEVL